MKHSVKETIIILVWTFFSMLIALALFNLIPVSDVEQQIKGTGINIIFAATLVIIFGAIFWYFLIKKGSQSLAEIYSIGIAFMFVGIIDEIIALSFFIKLILLIISFTTYMLLVKKLRSAWKNIQKWVQLNNLITIFLLVAIAISAGKAFNPFIATGLLFVVAVYDAIAVWKLETMQEMALAFINKRIIPGVAIAKKKEGKFALLGGGDIFFLILIPVAFAQVSMALAILTALGMYLSLVYLFIRSEKNKFYPAIPFMFIGMACSFIIWIVINIGMVVK